MQVQTLTITTENTKIDSNLFRITSFEMKLEAFCDCCGNNASGTETALKNQGWGLYATCQFCPECNY